MVLPLGKLKPSVDLFENLFKCTDEAQEKVGIEAFGTLVVDCTKKQTVRNEQNNILMHLKEN